MSRLPQAVQDVASTLQFVMQDVAEVAAARSGWCQRQRKLSGATLVQAFLVQALTLGFLSEPQATRCQLAQAAACAGVSISPQGLTKRLNQKAALLMQQVLEAAVAQSLCARAVRVPLLNRFSSVWLQDSTVITLPGSPYRDHPTGGTGRDVAGLRPRQGSAQGSGAFRFESGPDGGAAFGGGSNA